MKRLYLVVLAIFAITFAMAKDSYIAQPTIGAEYFFANKTNDKDVIKIQTTKYYNSYELIGCEIVDSKVVKDYSSIECDIEKELFEYSDGKDVIFDYSMQVGDTLNVAIEHLMPTCYGYISRYYIRGKHIEVTSIESINYKGIERLKYNLKTQNFRTFIEYGYTTPEIERPREEDYFQTYERQFVGNYMEESWIEGIGYTSRFYYDSWNKEDQQIEQYTLHCAFENGENIYTAEGAECDGLSDNINEKIDFSTLTLHRSGDVLMVTFPTVGKGEAITLYDATGRVVITQPIREGATTASIDVATLPDGIYIARLSSGSTAKVVL